MVFCWTIDSGESESEKEHVKFSLLCCLIHLKLKIQNFPDID